MSMPISVKPSREVALERVLVGGMLLTMAAIAVPQLAPAAEDDPRVTQLAATLEKLADRLERYRAGNREGTYPDLARLGWAPLIEQGLLDAPPVNPLNGSHSIAAAGEPGAGWHYDPVTGSIGACYFDEGTRRPTPDRP